MSPTPGGTAHESGKEKPQSNGSNSKVSESPRLLDSPTEEGVSILLMFIDERRNLSRANPGQTQSDSGAYT